MNTFLQVWGGLFYLLSKVLLARAEEERETPYSRWRVAGWITYLLGVIPWILLFLQEKNWIAASVEAGAIPSMLLGLAIATYSKEGVRPWIRYAVGVFVYGLLVVGIGYSLYDFGGITRVTQGLELAIVASFLLGTHALAHKQLRGWLWFLVMNGSTGTLMFLQDKWILAAQQGLSVMVVLFVLLRAVQRRRDS